MKPQLTVRKPIKSPVLSPILLQIYCIGLIELITHLFWVWAVICDPTVTIEFIKKKKKKKKRKIRKIKKNVIGDAS